jgi:hypothetical protein
MLPYAKFNLDRRTPEDSERGADNDAAIENARSYLTAALRGCRAIG